MKITREFAPADRYAYDFGLCSYDNGFAQIDTKQDAWYYGTWCSPSRRAIVSYAEGDVTLAVAEDDAEFAAELRRMAAWNEENGWGPMKIDPGFSPEMKAAFEAIGVDDLLH